MIKDTVSSSETITCLLRSAVKIDGQRRLRYFPFTPTTRWVSSICLCTVNISEHYRCHYWTDSVLNPDEHRNRRNAVTSRQRISQTLWGREKRKLLVWEALVQHPSVVRMGERGGPQLFVSTERWTMQPLWAKSRSQATAGSPSSSLLCQSFCFYNHLLLPSPPLLRPFTFCISHVWF